MDGSIPHIGDSAVLQVRYQSILLSDFIEKEGIAESSVQAEQGSQSCTSRPDYRSENIALYSPTLFSVFSQTPVPIQSSCPLKTI